MSAVFKGLQRRMSRQASSSPPLAIVPVRPKPRILPLDVRNAPVLHVGAETITVLAPAVEWSEERDLARYDEKFGNRENNRAALRNYLDQPFDWGRGTDGTEEVRLAVLLHFDDRFLTVVLEGTEAAVRRALPDQESLASWRAAGATEFPLWDFAAGPGQAVGVRWVPIAEVSRLVKVVQMEYLTGDRRDWLEQPI